MAVYTDTASKAQVAAGIGSSDASVPVSAFTGWPSAFPYWALINRGQPGAELVLVTGGSGSSLTITRGQGNTLPSAHNAGETFEHIAPAKHFNDAETHVQATAGVHGVSGSLVGTSGVQTIVDKDSRGHFTHDFADANPSGVASGFEVKASTPLARDGFTVTNTGADSAKRAFLLTQSGTARHEVFNDGTTKNTPNTAASRPGHEVNVTATQSALRVTNSSSANATAFNVDGDGDTTVGGALGVTGNATVGGTLGVTGATSIAGSETVGGTLAVTGTSTLTGDVTLPPPATGTGTRLEVNARTGGLLFSGKNQSGISVARWRDTGQLELNDKLYIYNGFPVVALVNSVTDVPSPSSAMAVLDNSDGFIKQWNAGGSNWVTLAPFKQSAPLGRLGHVTGAADANLNLTETLIDSFTYNHTASRYETIDFYSRFSLNTTGVLILRFRMVAGTGPVTTASPQIGGDINIKGDGSNSTAAFRKIFPPAARAFPTGQKTIGVFALVGAGAATGVLNGSASGNEREFSVIDQGA